jgi:peptidoglycan/xylan/chitin deacetylase (PgdA/CDA1 family)
MLLGSPMGRGIFTAFILFAASALFAAPAHAVERPPQFVEIAFDNCTELERWKELTAFAADMNKDGDRLHFTFFVSGVNFIADANRNLYQAPGHSRGASSIGFGGTPDEVRQRVDYMNAAYLSGHEIGSHAVGHFSGRGWSAGDWERELHSFRDILAKVGPDNGHGDGVKFVFPQSQVTGFRAPYLDFSSGLYTALKDAGFRYDTSSDSQPDAWPNKVGGLWRFNLADIELYHTNKHLLSMDYNFFVAQSHASVVPSRHQFFREQMLETYLDYFKTNYTGNRAPIHIGHHFFDYQNGAYREALLAFTQTVCGLPEVRCTTYSTLADFLERQDPATLAAYQAGDFPHAADPFAVADNWTLRGRLE